SSALTFASSDKIDSLKNVINTSSADTTKIKALNKLGRELMYKNQDTAISLGKRALKLAEKVGDKKKIASTKNNLGIYYDIKNNNSKALKYHFNALDINKEINYKKGLAENYNNIGIIYWKQSKYPKALNYYFKSLNIKKEMDDKKHMASTLNNIGGIFFEQSNYPKALEYYFKSLEIEKDKKNQKGIASTYNNIGIIYFKQSDYSKALKYHFKALKIVKEKNNKRKISNNYNNIGNIYFEKSNYPKSLEYYYKALDIRKEMNLKKRVASSLSNISTALTTTCDKTDSTKQRVIEWAKSTEEWKKNKVINRNIKEKILSLAERYQKRALKIEKEMKYIKGMIYSFGNFGKIFGIRGQLQKATNFYKKEFRIADTINTLGQKKDAAIGLSEVYEKMGKNDSALKYHKLYSELKDTIFSKEKQKELGRQESKFKWKQKLIKKEKEQEKQQALAEERAQRQRVIIYSVSGGAVLILVFLGLLYNRFRIIRSQKEIIEEQKSQVETKKQEAEEQKQIAEEKNNEILDSINYASRLQEAILPPMSMFEKHLTEPFVLFKPKEKVSGDFYWLEVPSVGTHGRASLQREPIVYLAAADCTGHGVPGAMVSVVCSNALTKSLMEEGIREPGKILDRTRELVVETFGRSEKEIKDGMDISLCALNSKTNELQWAGANNPLWVIRPNAKEVEDIKPNKEPVGKFAGGTPFTSHTIQLEEGTSLYMFSDGFPDQFGGEKGKKYKAKRMKEFLLNIQNESMEKQRALMDKEFEEWKGENEQVDDVCVIGLKV
ncbi:MAG: tetratricopeptide repeat protein, partial [Flavobacteriales bacterium]